MSSYAVLGPGGVGGLVAAALARAGRSVLVVAREATADLINRQGISVCSVTLGEFVARAPATPVLTDPVDVLFVATKATGLNAALERIATAPRLVIPLLNGLDHLPALRQRFGDDRVAAGVIRIEADRPQSGRVVHTSPTVRVDLASDQPALVELLPPVQEALVQAGIPTQIGAGEAQVLWSKLVRLNALSATTSVSDRPIGFIRSDPEWRATLIACIGETAAAANADGATIDPSATLGELDAAHPELGSSMQRDLQAGRVPELDAIQGSVMRAAARHGLACPTVTRLAGQIARRAGLEVPLIR